MGLQGYVGTGTDVQRIRRQEKEREEERRKYEEARTRVEEGSVKANAFKEFGKATSETLEQAFRNETVGLVSRADFASKRADLQERYEEEERERKRAREEKVLKERRRKRSQLQAKANKLSFVGADDDEEEDDEGGGSGGYALDLFRRSRGGGGAKGQSEPATTNAKKYSNYGKNPDAATEFLPDVDRDIAEAKRRKELEEEFRKEEEEAKSQPLKIVYSYWDGGGHRREVTTKQGDTIGAFLKLALDQLAPEFRQVQSSSVENLMYIKEDLILPQHMTFHELIVNKARGKSGPLFDFGVTEDVRLKQDARVEKTDSHAGKVVERHWYEKNKHIFPASRWEMYDPQKTFDKYTIS
ncbi:XAP5 circadian clock regulator [Chloropicon primus]|uniref:XAP5 circadian clock regulator n=1 Tax=Chloropicon primus TaxID=1764295 RepID=A0A5B8MCI4_9CHLO|nr:XAP5 circadian clock regulator [Chloropicon primus]UPQ97057.1 XAP5 circadian clock regulator [Chloropicon primus]|eukprot:QDZ17841.1 XAP5 circadian clock regulator [Chloropicon primus]